MKVKEMVGFGNGSIRITLESEHPAELAMIRLMDDCEAKCEAKTPDIPPEANHLPGTLPVDPELHINVTVKNNRYR